MLNQVFNRLTVIQDDGGKTVLCRCTCGKEKLIIRYNLKEGLTKSCGCLRNERVKISNSTHGKSHTRFWNLHQNMMRRCYDPTRNNYSRYGGAGIYVASEWHDPATFIEWCEKQEPAQGLQIDRIDSGGPYSPANCRFVTIEAQARNRRHHKRYSYNGEELLLVEIMERFAPNGLSLKTVWNRLNKGDSVERALRSVQPTDY